MFKNLHNLQILWFPKNWILALSSWGILIFALKFSPFRFIRIIPVTDRQLQSIEEQIFLHSTLKFTWWKNVTSPFVVWINFTLWMFLLIAAHFNTLSKIKQGVTGESTSECWQTWHGFKEEKKKLMCLIFWQWTFHQDNTVCTHFSCKNIIFANVWVIYSYPGPNEANLIINWWTFIFADPPCSWIHDKLHVTGHWKISTLIMIIEHTF